MYLLGFTAIISVIVSFAEYQLGLFQISILLILSLIVSIIFDGTRYMSLLPHDKLIRDSPTEALNHCQSLQLLASQTGGTSVVLKSGYTGAQSGDIAAYKPGTGTDYNIHAKESLIKIIKEIMSRIIEK